MNFLDDIKKLSRMKRKEKEAMEVQKKVREKLYKEKMDNERREEATQIAQKLVPLIKRQIEEAAQEGLFGTEVIFNNLGREFIFGIRRSKELDDLLVDILYELIKKEFFGFAVSKENRRMDDPDQKRPKWDWVYSWVIKIGW